MRVDFRSDTITLPTAAMKEAMFNAPLGDDVFDDDPSVHELQELAAAMFGMEDALFCCSGTQTNQIAIKVHTRSPGEVICHSYSHIYKYEGGGVASNSGVACYLLGGDRGILAAEDIKKAIKIDDVHFPESQLISLENTCNKGGGSCYTLDEIKAIRAVSLDYKIPLHLDGARLANAIVAKGYSAHDIGQQFDSISLCLSKGLGAPIGSVLIGSKPFIKKARRIRKSFGGGMRQAGLIAKAGTYALQHHVNRLAEDHKRAQYLAGEIATCHWIDHCLEAETNILIAELSESFSVDQVVKELARHNIWVSPFGERQIRFVTHLDLNDPMIERTIEVCRDLF